MIANYPDVIAGRLMSPSGRSEYRCGPPPSIEWRPGSGPPNPVCGGILRFGGGLGPALGPTPPTCTPGLCCSHLQRCMDHVPQTDKPATAIESPARATPPAADRGRPAGGQQDHTRPGDRVREVPDESTSAPNPERRVSVATAAPRTASDTSPRAGPPFTTVAHVHPGGVLAPGSGPRSGGAERGSASGHQRA